MRMPPIIRRSQIALSRSVGLCLCVGTRLDTLFESHIRTVDHVRNAYPVGLRDVYHLSEGREALAKVKAFALRVVMADTCQ